MDWYPKRPIKYAGDTAHLTLAEHGAYNLLIDWYMLHEIAPPDDDAALARILGVSIAEWQQVATRVRAFFLSSGTSLKHKRCEIELGEQSHRKKSWAKKKRKQRAAKLLKLQQLGHKESPPCPPNVPSDRTGQDRTGHKERTPDIAAVTLTRNWQPSEAVKMWASLRCLTDDQLAEQIEHFRSHYLGKGTTAADWDETFKSWLIKSKQFASRPTNGNGAHYPRKEDNTDAVRRGVERTVQDIAEAADRAIPHPGPTSDRNALAVLHAKAGKER